MYCELCAETFTDIHGLMSHVSSSENHWGSSIEYFSCIPCSMSLHSIPDVIQHMESEEHSFMVLATGVHFDATYMPNAHFDAYAERSQISDLFPPMEFCILCNYRDCKPYEEHLKSSTHKKIAWLMRAICRKKKINYTNYFSDNHVSVKAQEFMNKIINMKQKEFLGEEHASDRSLEFVCVLCNIHFNKYEYYKRHLSNLSHKRMGQFLMKISLVVKELDIIGYTPDAKVTETFSNSFAPLYHCELCCVWINESPLYSQHISGYSHKRVEELVSKVTSKRNGEAISLSLKRHGFSSVNHFNRFKDYCKVCAVWCLDGKQHLMEDINHKKIEHFIDDLIDESDKKFIKVYIDAQARVNFGDTPPNYCKVCNILYSKSEKYKQHLTSKDHERAEQPYLKGKNGNGEKTSKKLKTSSFSPSGKVRSKSVVNYSHFNSAHGTHRKSKEIKSKLFNKKKNACGKHRSRHSSWLDLKDRVTISTNSSWLHFANNSNSSFRLHFGSGERNDSSTSRRHFGDGETNGSSTSRRDFGDSKTNDSSSSRRHFGDSKTNGSSTSRRHFGEAETNGSSTSRRHFGEGETNGTAELFCELCNYSSTNPLHYDKHLMGENHKRMRKMLDKKEPKTCIDPWEYEPSRNSHPLQYNCELCDVLNYNSEEYDEHLNSQKHKRNQWFLYVLMQKPLSYE